MKKKIGILTLPPRINYGGILQAYALSKVVENLGYDVSVIERLKHGPSFIWKLLSHIKTLGMKCLGRDKSFNYWPNSDEFQRISQNTRIFTDEFLNKKTVYTSVELNKLLKDSDYYAVIVGSDQVWRPNYVANIYDYFLDFKCLENVIKLSYAASMGVDNWPYTKKQAHRIFNLCSKFRAISVREDIAKSMLESRFGLEVEHVLDPTMLLEKNTYIDIFKCKSEGLSPGSLFTYILDPTEDKKEMIHRYENELQLKSFSCQPLNVNLNSLDIKNSIDDFVYPRVTKWLRSFYDAEFVITDSFHGCVFSIIFNKPFVALSNKSKGQARFTSLLRLFNLSHRLDFVPVENAYDINWDNVNYIKKTEAKNSLKFLTENL